MENGGCWEHHLQWAILHGFLNYFPTFPWFSYDFPVSPSRSWVSDVVHAHVQYLKVPVLAQGAAQRRGAVLPEVVGTWGSLGELGWKLMV